ncbi:hypothetical protein AN958_05331 [Leucoagaricus sp. SymC.cos]|nr:hypothetical protein AN958_05331 [Leucoagaricus sp. SymC.cos]
MACFVQRIPASSGLEGGRLPIAPLHPHPDNVNGNSFFIRSAIRPQIYWFYNPTSDRIELSSTQQTKFRIERKIPLPFDCPKKEDILIGSDDVHIYIVPDAGDSVREESLRRSMVVRYRYTKKNLTIAVPSVVNVEDGTFKFGLFDGGFGGQYSADYVHGKAGFVYLASRPDGGERWEFVS